MFGEGIFWYTNGSFFQGSFVRGLPEGWGELVGEGGGRRAGIWKEGKLVQEEK